MIGESLLDLHFISGYSALQTKFLKAFVLKLSHSSDSAQEYDVVHSTKSFGSLVLMCHSVRSLLLFLFILTEDPAVCGVRSTENSDIRWIDAIEG